MSKQKQIQTQGKQKDEERKVDPNQKREEERVETSQLKPMPPIVGGDISSTNGQAGRLADGRFAVAQRQELAAHIAETQGNQHMVKVMTSLKHNGSNVKARPETKGAEAENGAEMGEELGLGGGHGFSLAGSPLAKPTAGQLLRSTKSIESSKVMMRSLLDGAQAIVQPKLEVNEPGDVYEQEADETADQVMRMAEPAVVEDEPEQVQRASHAAGVELTNTDKFKDLDSEVQRAGVTVTPELEQNVQSLQGRGQALPETERNFFESRFGADFSQVRIHNDSQAGQTSRDLQARAFTVGSDIAFGAGEYQPGTNEGRRLIAHELTHVVQQTGAVSREVVDEEETVAIQPKLEVNEPGDVYEQEADQVMRMTEPDIKEDDSVGVQRASVGQPLIAHMVTPMVNRYSLHRLVVQRGGGAGGGQPSADTQPNASTPGQAAQGAVYFGGVTLMPDAALVRVALENIVKQEGLKGLDKFVQGLEADQENKYAPQTTVSDEAGPDLAKKVVQLVKSEADKIKQLQERLVASFESAAVTYTGALLQESRKTLEQEKEKYGLEKNAPSGGGDSVPSGGVGAPDAPSHSMADNDATRGLVAAATDLHAQKTEIDRLQGELNAELQPLEGPGDQGAEGALGYDPRSESDKAKREELLNGPKSTHLENLKFKYKVARAAAESQYPILAAYGDIDNPEGLAEIAKGAGSAATTIGPLIDEKLANIEKVEKGVGKIIWKNELIIKGTKAQMGLAAGSLDEKLVEEYKSDKESDELLANLAVGIIAIALGLIAAIPTGGASMAAAAATTAAAAGGAAISMVQAVKAVEQYQLEKAATGTDVDKAKAISQEEPSMFWLALDIVGAVVDIHGALAAFKTLKQQVRAVMMMRSLAKEGEEAMKSAEMVAELDKLKALMADKPGLYEKVLAHVGEVKNEAAPVLAEAEKLARQQYKTLAEAGRLKEIGDIPTEAEYLSKFADETERLAAAEKYNSLAESNKLHELVEKVPTEEEYIKKYLFGMKQQIVVSGEKGIARAKAINELMNPDNPLIKSVLSGDKQAMDGMLIQYGNWKQLMTMLDRGSPEMRLAAQKLMERRAFIEKEVQEFFQAKLVGKPSTTAVSDVDRTTAGVDSGEMMRIAEEWVSQKYGPGWNEVLRMNFYTDITRLTQYEDVMKHLNPEQAAKLLAKTTEQTEIYNIAKMMHQGSTEEATALAKTLNINLDDPRIAEALATLKSGKSIEERNKLVEEIDKLVTKYKSLPDGSPEKLQLAEEITAQQMKANLFSDEAYIGPGAGRMIAGQVKVVGHEAYQAALSQMEMVAHQIHENAGDIAVAMRQYEIYKYMNRFATAAEMSGVKTEGIDFWKAISHYVNKTDRAAAEGDITDEALRSLYGTWQGFSQKALADMKKAALDNPAAWTP